MLGDSKRAIQVNIQIIKTFTRLRQLVATNKEILEKVEKMEKITMRNLEWFLMH